MKITKLNEVQISNKNKEKEQFAIDVLTGFTSSPKSLSSKYFYDDYGSQLFQAITQQEDYYLTNIELNILQNSKDALPELVQGEEIDIIELGAGDGHKTKILLQGFLDSGFRVNFYPIDISYEAMNLLNKNIQDSENLFIHGVVGEYIDGLRYVRSLSQNQQIVLFLGSNLGNFDMVSSQVFLRKVWKSMNAADYLFTGFDLKKDVSVLTKAYNDKQGYTRKFNLNLLTRMNNELGANFQLEDFQHFGVYNPRLGAMESYLLSLKEQTVYIKELERSFNFDAYEPIHLEYSFKFSHKDIAFLCEQTGYKIKHNFTDEKNYFVNSLWEVVKN
ncbi:MAG: L-histidine N(alpha)-methyltransferase [Bdellovibrionales bacterium]|nr:L-histidine N(alpha)-methyltransferase [Bdellovibrionales bacterium]